MPKQADGWMNAGCDVPPPSPLLRPFHARGHNRPSDLRCKVSGRKKKRPRLAGGVDDYLFFLLVQDEGQPLDRI